MLNQDSLNDPKYIQTKIPQLIYNPFGWSNFSNVLVVDTPPPVGFSYCDPIGPTGDGYSCGSWNDSYTAQSNYGFLINWYKGFSEFMSNELYIVGESYAGVYVPTLAREIVLGNPSIPINLKGFAIGDGCMGTDVLCGGGDGPYYTIEFMHGHGQFSLLLYQTIISSCSKADLLNGHLNATCEALIDKMWNEIGGYYSYNLYDECYDNNIFLKNRNWWDKSLPSSLRGAENDYPCPGSAMDIWINRTDVRVALNVPVNANFFSADNGNGFNYKLTEPNILPFINDAISQYNLRVLAYNGDADPSINSFATQDIYISYLISQGYQYKEWRPWTLDGVQQMGGYVTEFPNFSYLTIRGSGHMVPEYKPPASASFMSAWISNKDFPPYVPSKSKKKI
jgi:hypothetical protein